MDDEAHWKPPPGSPEPLWPALLCVASAITLQLILPKRVVPGERWMLPALELCLLGAMAVIGPMTLRQEHSRRRRITLTLTALVSADNIYSLALLAHYLVRTGRTGVAEGRTLILAGSMIWLTNVLMFSLWLWEVDRGGPGVRAAGHDELPDLLFPQMADGRFSHKDWRPKFIDYLYVSFTNATAFSPTDTMPLTATAKGVMGIQSLVSLVTIALVVSRAVNLL